MIMAITCLLGCEERAWAGGITTEASYYTVASTIREGTGSGIGLTASGEILKDEGEYTFAHPTLSFGKRLLITNQLNGRKIVASCTDRGPNTKCLKRGTGIDLNLSAFKALVGEDVSCGLVKVYLEVTK
jgi:rare lipoprotein A (peptidoglycan hydrolase)